MKRKSFDFRLLAYSHFLFSSLIIMIQFDALSLL